MFSASDDIQSSVLLTQSSSSLSANLLKKIMCLDKYSGGDSSGKLVQISLPYDDMRVIRYNKPNSEYTMGRIPNHNVCSIKS
jgi:hypothetical protein